MSKILQFLSRPSAEQYSFPLLPCPESVSPKASPRMLLNSLSNSISGKASNRLLPSSALHYLWQKCMPIWIVCSHREKQVPTWSRTGRTRRTFSKKPSVASAPRLTAGFCSCREFAALACGEIAVKILLVERFWHVRRIAAERVVSSSFFPLSYGRPRFVGSARTRRNNAIE